MEELKIIDAQTLLCQPMEKPAYIMQGVIPAGLTLFCASQKIGKSWLMLALCLAVSKGTPMWGIPTQKGGVLYLCLEDTFGRMQDRLFKLTDDAAEGFHIAVSSCKLTDGLIDQLDGYMKDNAETKLIMIDTLQKIRSAGKDNAYAGDYGDVSLLKDFADRYGIAVIAVHHIRKQGDSDVFNRVSGTMGLTGSADATFVLEKEQRSSDTARLHAVGRDIEYQVFTLRFADCRWEVLEHKGQRQLTEESIPPFLLRLVEFMAGKEMWCGSATELAAALKETETPPNIITKLLNQHHDTFLRDKGISYGYERSRDGRKITLQRAEDTAGEKRRDSCDSYSDISPASVTPPPEKE